MQANQAAEWMQKAQNTRIHLEGDAKNRAI